MAANTIDINDEVLETRNKTCEKLKSGPDKTKFKKKKTHCISTT